MAWLIWLAATLLLSAYFVSGYVAARSEFVPITLSPGFVTNQKVLSIRRRSPADEFGVSRRAHQKARAWRVHDERAPGGPSRIFESGAEIILKASSDSSAAPTPYSALPKTGHNQFHIFRNLVAELSEGPGKWKWPPTNRGLALKPGTNDVRIEVATVGRELAGENINLIIHSEIGFNACGSQVCWLWGWFAWPLFLVVQLIWAFVLFRTAPSRKT